MRMKDPLPAQSRSAAALAAALGVLISGATRAQEPQFEEHVEIRQVVLETRVVAGNGEPVLGLGVDDFAVTVAGAPVTLRAVSWVGAVDKQAVADALLAGEPLPVMTPRPGRLFVLFYQLGWDRSRVVGHLRMGQYISKFLDTLTPEDRVAVAVFGSHLQVHLDFTDDREAIDDATRITEVMRDLAPPRRAGSPSLVRTIDWRAAEDAATPEDGLLVVAQALERIGGPKTVLWIGWGMGRLDRMGVVVTSKAYGLARLSLARAHAAVFTLDITDADYHSLEVGLQQVAEDTGGTYAKTHLFPEIALGLLDRTLAGHYELAFDLPALPAGIHEIKVELTRARGRLLYNELLSIRR